MKMCKRVLILFIVLISTVSITVSATTLHTFTSDYDTGIYTTEQVYFDVDESVSQDLYPLKVASESLPIDVGWDNTTREIVINNFPLQHINSNIPERRYKTSELPDSLKIKNGITYCSPKFLSDLLGGVGFLYNNEVYCFVGEDVESKLIDSGVSDVFKSNVITTMYAMKLKMPDEYEFIRKYLTGGIKCVQRGEDPKVPIYAPAYIYASHSNPCCCIVGDKAIGTTLAGYIGHEAYHAWQYRNGGINEHDAKVYGNIIKSTLKLIN